MMVQISDASRCKSCYTETIMFLNEEMWDIFSYFDPVSHYISENRVVIIKMRQYKSGQAVQMFNMAFLET